MHISALTSCLPFETAEAIDRLAECGFEWVDVPPAAAGGESRRRIEARGMRVGCVALGRDLPPGVDLSNQEKRVREQSVRYFLQAIESASRLGAPVGYLTPPVAAQPDALERWADCLIELGDHAVRHDVRVCVEHFPGRALPTLRQTLAFLHRIDHAGLALLLDVGHCLISREDPAAAVSEAGPWLGYVHLDDNDGREDRHWPLLSSPPARGKLTLDLLRRMLAALRALPYRAALCLELNPTLADPLENLRLSRDLVAGLLAGGGSPER